MEMPVPLSQNDLALLRKPSIKNQLLKAEGGRYWVERVVGGCSACNRSIDTDKMFGNVTVLSEKEIEIEAMGICYECYLGTRFHGVVVAE